jgi:hypothetical protein
MNELGSNTSHDLKRLQHSYENKWIKRSEQYLNLIDWKCDDQEWYNFAIVQYTAVLCNKKTNIFILTLKVLF